MNLIYFAAGLVDSNSLPQPLANNDSLKNILNIVFITIGAFAFFLLVLAGFRYVIAQGDPQKVATAKNQIVYTAIGLVVSASAYAIVNLVLERVN